MKKSLLVFLLMLSVASPAMAEEVQYPFLLDFKHKEYQDLDKILPNVKLFEKVEGWNPDMASSGEVFVPKYFIATYDLNSDGKQEIFLYREGMGMCGSAGCKLQIYAANDENKLAEIIGEPDIGIITWNIIYIQKDITKEYHDIKFGDGRNIWRWDGKSYQIK